MLGEFCAYTKLQNATQQEAITNATEILSSEECVNGGFDYLQPDLLIMIGMAVILYTFMRDTRSQHT
jgi:hypothetical protein